MKNIHYRYCLVGIALAAAALLALGVSASTLGFLAAVLLCPVMMFMMMRMAMGSTNQSAPPSAPVEQDLHR